MLGSRDREITFLLTDIRNNLERKVEVKKLTDNFKGEVENSKKC